MFDKETKEAACVCGGRGSPGGADHAPSVANSLFHHQPDAEARPKSKLEAAYHKADASLRNIIQLLEAA